MAADTKEDLSAAQAALSQFTKEPIGSASAPPSSPPASGSSGSHGTGSGNAGGASGSGGSPPGDSTGSSNDNHDGKPMDDQESRKRMLRVMVVAMAILGCLAGLAYIAAAYSALKMTTPEGMAQTERMLIYSDKQEARRHAEEMKVLENQGKRIDERREERARRNGTASSTPRAAILDTVACTPVDAELNTRRQPTKLGASGCISRGTTMDGHWLSLESPATRIRGVVRFSEINMGPGEGGKMQVIGEKDWCQTDQSADNCLTWLSKRVGNTTLWFTNRGPVEIATN